MNLRKSESVQWLILSASPFGILECWNTGILVNQRRARIIALFPPIIPIFHHSSRPMGEQSADRQEVEL